MRGDNGRGEEPGAGAARTSPRGEKWLAAFDGAIKVVKVSLVVFGLAIAAVALSGVDMADLDQHPVLRYRMAVLAAVIVGWLLFDRWIGRRRAERRLQVGAGAEPRVDRGSSGLGAVGFAAALVAAGGAAFWHDHGVHDIPHPVAVQGRFVGATCVVAQARTVVRRGPHMAIGYEFPSPSTRTRSPQVTCLLDHCPPPDPPAQRLDTEYKQVPYASLAECTAALPAVLAAKAPATVWTGDKDPNAAVRARFTPERDEPPYFLLWVPLLIAAVVTFRVIAMRNRRRSRT